MKKPFHTPYCRIVPLEAIDIIATSGDTYKTINRQSGNPQVFMQDVQNIW